MMSPGAVYDVIVVGAGVEGSSTAYNLAKDNVNTLLLDQFPLPHTRGSSHGQSRITRMAYEKECYANLMPTAYKMWEQLEKEENVQIYIKSGLLTLDQEGPKSGYMESIVEALKKIQAPYETLSHSELSERFPSFRLAESYGGVWDPVAGVLRADKALQSLWNQFRAHGGTLHDGEPVVRITPGQVVTVTTTDASYRGHSVVLCAGPWTNRLTAPLGLHLPLKSTRVGVFYWKLKSEQFRNTLPCCIFNDVQTDYCRLDMYGLPSLEYPLHYKLCAHGGEPIDPECRDSQKALDFNKRITDDMKTFVSQHLPVLEPETSIQEACIYTITPDWDFILDTHPHWKNIVVGAGFSGHGFKMAPVVGKILAELATGRAPSFDIKEFSIERFHKMDPKSKI